MNREYYRRRILKEMCFWAENIHEYYNEPFVFTHIKFEGVFPRAFKPGIGDRQLFNKILTDEIIDKIIEDNKEDQCNFKMIGLHVMNQLYFPQYGEYLNVSNKSRFLRSFFI